MVGKQDRLLLAEAVLVVLDLPQAFLFLKLRDLLGRQVPSGPGELVALAGRCGREARLWMQPSDRLGLRLLG